MVQSKDSGWTEEMHRSFLNDMETSFVKRMFPTRYAIPTVDQVKSKCDDGRPTADCCIDRNCGGGNDLKRVVFLSRVVRNGVRLIRVQTYCLCDSELEELERSHQRKKVKRGNSDTRDQVVPEFGNLARRVDHTTRRDLHVPTPLNIF